MDSTNASTATSRTATHVADAAPTGDGRKHRHRRTGAYLLALALMASVMTLMTPSGASPAQAAPGVSAGGDWIDVAMGVQHTCARSAKGEVRCWGANLSGQLGIGNTNDIGDNGGEMGNNLDPVDLGTDRTAAAVAAGFSHSCALLDDASVKCWGDNSLGQLGVGNTFHLGDNAGEMGDNLPTVDLGTGRTATAITAGFGHTCALLDDGTVKCWGLNTLGQLGQGDLIARGDNAGEMGDNLAPIDLGTGRTAVGISTSFIHTCALLDNGLVKCWGANAGGQLGLGDTAGRGGAANQMGDNLPVAPLGTGRTATSVSAASAHTCALLDDATVKCWGGGAFGALGYGDVAGRGDGPGEMGDNLPTVDLGTGRSVVAIDAGGTHSCARLDDLSLKCWGSNNNGQLLLGDAIPRGDNVGEMGDNLPALDFGDDRFVTAVTASVGSTCAVLDINRISCWGLNTRGQLGRGNTNAYGDDAGENAQTVGTVNVGSLLIDPAGVDSFLPARLVETRVGESTVDGLQQGIGRRAAGQVTEVQVTGRAGIDNEVDAAIVNLGIVNPAGNGFAVGYPCDEPQPASSTINYRAGETIANAATIKLSAIGTICIYTNRATDLILDVTSVIPFGSTVNPISPARFFDTREGFQTSDGEQQAQGRRTAGQVTEVEIGTRNGVPFEAVAATVNIAAITPDENGFIAAWACGQPQPTASMINYEAGKTIAGGATISLGEGDAICVYTQRAMDLVVDVTAYTLPGAIIDPQQPARLLETRAGQPTVDGLQQGIGRRGAGKVTEVQVVDRVGVTGAATAGIFNVAVVNPEDDGFAAIWPCGEAMPGSSAINFRAGQTIANNATIQLSAAGTICVYTHRATDLVVDLTATIR
ncbi:MAG: hypothetical protein AAFY28_08190 [Actinomycetota bacterium]